MLEIASMLGLRERLDSFVARFGDCIKSSPTRGHPRSYVAGPSGP